MSAALAGAPSLAVGDLLGSDMANMAILGVIDLPPSWTRSCCGSPASAR